ncbi:MAG TPA: PEGA domain-containing protein [Gemmatimonadaceae bacterium]|nr:PEGA domain-containing protein [Gemmatimonadaceae bacterium]
MKQIAALIAIVTLSACASIMHGKSQDVGISSSPTGATVTIDNQSGGQTPFIANLSRKDNHIVKLELAGFAPAEMTLTRKTSGWVWGNILFGGLIGLAVDAITGGLYNLTPEQLTSTLAAQQASIAPTKDGIYVILAREVDPSWIKVGQLVPLTAPALSE